MQESLGSTDSTNHSGDDDVSHRVVRHRKCANWGRGLLLWERDGKRGYQFEDGQVRVFKEGFFHLLEEDQQSDASVRNTLAGMNKHSSGSKNATGGDTPSFSFEDQMTHFLTKYPGGFAGKDWLAKHRGRGQKRHLKRHRDSVIKEATNLIGPSAVEGLLDSGGHAELHDRIKVLLEKTDLVPKRKLTDFSRLHVSPTLGRAFADVLASAKLDRKQFDSLRTALAAAGMKEPGWALITAVMCLVHPAAHAYVRPNIYVLQGKLISVDMLIPSQPTAVTYERCREMMNQVKALLGDAGYPPEDMLDVFDFSWVTLRPAEHEALATLALERNRAKSRVGLQSDESSDDESSDDESADDESTDGAQASSSDEADDDDTGTDGDAEADESDEEE